MTEFFKTNPIALRHCLLYEFLQGNCAEKAFDDVSQTVGKNVMNKKEIQILFRRFAKGKFYKNSKKHDHTNAKEIFQSDKKALRTCILYLSLKSPKKTKKNPYLLRPMNRRKEHNLFRSNPSFVMYEEFRKVIGGDVMEFKEFDFWFHRFLNGEYDLNFERDEEKKIYELLDMPIDIMKNIVEYLDIYDRMNLSKTSRSLRTFVKDQQLSFRVVELSAVKDKTDIRIGNETTIEYVAKGDDCIKRFRKSEKIIEGVPHWKQALMDFNYILKTSKLKVNLLRISWNVDKTSYQPPSAIHDSGISWDLTHQLSVKVFSTHFLSVDPLLTILPFLKPGYLTTIKVHMTDPKGDGWQKIVDMEQWKQAKHFHHSRNMLDIPIRHFYHFKSFVVFVWKSSVEEVFQMKEVLFTSSGFEGCSLTIDNFMDSFYERTLDELFGNAIKTTPYRIYHYPIPDSTEYFEIKIDGRRIYIDRRTISK